MMRALVMGVAVAMLLLGSVGCSTAPRSSLDRERLRSEADFALRQMKEADPTLEVFLDRGVGFAMFPSIGKGGMGFGGAWGRGVVYQGGTFVGFTDMTQATVGFQLGAQSYAELIVFQNELVLEQFKSGNFAFAANASAVVVTAGIAGKTDFRNGTAVFTRPNGGLMYEASIGGQRFTFVPAGSSEAATPAP
jgi:lipid-binding SYLF domain-containing protein